MGIRDYFKEVKDYFKVEEYSTIILHGVNFPDFWKLILIFLPYPL